MALAVFAKFAQEFWVLIDAWHDVDGNGCLARGKGCEWPIALLVAAFGFVMIGAVADHVVVPEDWCATTCLLEQCQQDFSISPFVRVLDADKIVSGRVGGGFGLKFGHDG